MIAWTDEEFDWLFLVACNRAQNFRWEAERWERDGYNASNIRKSERSWAHTAAKIYAAKLAAEEDPDGIT